MVNKRNVEAAASFVRLIGLEPTRPKSPDPKSGASTNFATSAREMGLEAHGDFKEHFRAEAKTRSNFATSASNFNYFIATIYNILWRITLFSAAKVWFFVDKCEKKVTFLYFRCAKCAIRENGRRRKDREKAR